MGRGVLVGLGVEVLHLGGRNPEGTHPGSGVLVGVGVFVAVGVFVGELVGVFVGVLVGVSVGVLVGVLVGVFVGVLVGVLVGVSVGMLSISCGTTSAGMAAPSIALAAEPELPPLLNATSITTRNTISSRPTLSPPYIVSF